MGILDDLVYGGRDRNGDGKIDCADARLAYLERERWKKIREDDDNRRYGWYPYNKKEYDDEGNEIDEDDEFDEFDDDEVCCDEDEVCCDDDDDEFDDDDYYDNDYADDFDEDEPSKQPLSSTVTVEEKKGTRDDSATDALKYYDEEFNEWSFVTALLDHFPELKEDYDRLSENDVGTIIDETFDFAPDRAITYLKWLWKTFTPDLFRDESDSSGEDQSFICRGIPIRRLARKEGFYCYVKECDDFLFAAFRNCLHGRHDTSLLRNYIEMMINNNDFDGAKEAYSGYLYWQEGRYSPRDLGDVILYWAYFINWSSFPYADKIAMAEKLLPIAVSIGVRGEKTVKRLRADIADWSNTIAKKEEEEEAKREVPYVWRKWISPYHAGLVDPQNYETKEEYDEALCQKLDQMDAERKEKLRLLYLDETPLQVCLVDVYGHADKALYYGTNGLDLKIGDYVIVPYGERNSEERGVIVAVGTCTPSSLPFPREKLKNVLRASAEKNKKNRNGK